jgi:hypothetical protein
MSWGVITISTGSYFFSWLNFFYDVEFNLATILPIAAGSVVVNAVFFIEVWFGVFPLPMIGMISAGTIWFIVNPIFCLYAQVPPSRRWVKGYQDSWIWACAVIFYWLGWFAVLGIVLWVRKGNGDAWGALTLSILATTLNLTIVSFGRYGLRRKEIHLNHQKPTVAGGEVFLHLWTVFITELFTKMMFLCLQTSGSVALAIGGQLLFTTKMHLQIGCYPLPSLLQRRIVLRTDPFEQRVKAILAGWTTMAEVASTVGFIMLLSFYLNFNDPRTVWPFEVDSSIYWTMVSASVINTLAVVLWGQVLRVSTINRLNLDPVAMISAFFVSNGKFILSQLNDAYVYPYLALFSFNAIFSCLFTLHFVRG